MCKVLQVSRSGFYSWLKTKPSPRKQKNEWLKFKMAIIFKENREVYGYRRLREALRIQGEHGNQKRVRRLMQKAGLKPKMQHRLTAALVINAVIMACFRRKIVAGLILHSDRGVQYTSKSYQKLLAEKGMLCSRVEQEIVLITLSLRVFSIQ